MKRTVLVRASVCALFIFSAAVAMAQQGEIRVAEVKGWRTDASKVVVYSPDGVRGKESDLRGQLKLGLLHWNPEYDLVKLNWTPGDQRWVRARDLDLGFCAKPLTQKIVTGGGAGENRALTMGSGEGCP